MKRLITAETIRQAKLSGQQEVEVVPSKCIITPEARSVAEELGIEIVEMSVCPSAGSSQKQIEAPAANASDNSYGNVNIADIRTAILAQLPAGGVSEEILNQLIQKVAAEQKLAARAAGEGAGANQAVYTSKRGVKRIKGNQVAMGIFAEAGKDKQIGLADVITAADHSPMAAGYMSWTNTFFPWTLTYDEINIVLEGELHIVNGGETAIAKAGDVLFIPKGSSIEFGTPTSVRFVFVTYPANYI